MPNITEEKWIEMLEKKADGTYIAKYPKVKSKSGITFDEHLDNIATQAGSNKIPRAKSNGKLDTSWFDLILSPADNEVYYLALESTYVSTRDITVGTATLPPVAGTVRIKFTLDPHNSTKAYGKVTVGGVEVMNYNSSSEKAYSKDVNVSGGEEVKFYLRSANGEAVFIRDMSIGYIVELKI